MKKLPTENGDIAYREHGNIESKKCLIFMSGFMGTAIYDDIQSHIQYFAKQGYHTIAFDAPGIRNSTGTYMPYNCIQALDDIVKHICKPEQDIYIIGHSQGGLFAMYYALGNDRIAGCGTLMSPMYIGENERWRETGTRTGTREIPGTDGETFTYNLPYAFHEELIDISKVVWAGLPTYTKPTLFITGSNDTIVSPESVQRNFGLSLEPKQIHILDCGHDYRDEPDVIEEITGYIEDFLCIHFPISK